MTTTTRITILLLALAAVALALTTGCGPDAPPRDPNEMVLRTYDLPDTRSAAELRSTISGLVENVGDARWLPNGGIAVTAPASLHEGIAEMVARVEAGGGAVTAPARTVSIDCWAVLGRPNGGAATAGPAVAPRVGAALDEVAEIHGGLEFRVLERARLTSVSEGSRATLDGRHLVMQQRIVTVDGDTIVADVEFQVRNDGRPTRNSVTTRVRLEADRVVVLGQAGYDMANGWRPPGWEPAEDILIFFVVTATMS